VELSHNIRKSDMERGAAITAGEKSAPCDHTGKLKLKCARGEDRNTGKCPKVGIKKKHSLGGEDTGNKKKRAGRDFKVLY